MALGIILFGLFCGCLLSILVGMVGARRRIGFTLTFLLSLFFSPLVGLIAALLSDELPYGEKHGPGCFGTLLGMLGFLLLAAVILVVLVAVIE